MTRRFSAWSTGGVDSITSALSRNLGFVKSGQALLHLGMVYPKLYTSFDTLEFMEGAEGAFHAFIQFLHGQEWERMQAIASKELAGHTQAVMQEFNGQGKAIVLGETGASGYWIEEQAIVGTLFAAEEREKGPMGGYARIDVEYKVRETFAVTQHGEKIEKPEDSDVQTVVLGFEGKMQQGCEEVQWRIVHLA